MDIDPHEVGRKERGAGVGFTGVSAVGHPLPAGHLRPLAMRSSVAERRTLPSSSLESCRDAAERVILRMYRDYAEPFSLQEMADVAGFSPHHFNRLFRGITGVTPARFLSAVRLRAAVQLLLTTELSVTELCFEVGYNSLGSFTSRFTQSVGIAPTRLRDLAHDAVPTLKRLNSYSSRLIQPRTLTPSVFGRVDGINATDRWIFVGLFQTSIPQGRPAACTLLLKPGAYRIGAAPDGHYFAFAAGFPRSSEPMNYLLPDFRHLKVGVGQGPVFVRDGRMRSRVDISMRPMRIIDPPILSAMPLLMVQKVRNLEEAAAD